MVRAHPALVACALVVGAGVAEAAPPADAPARRDEREVRAPAQGDWREARWGMSVEELLHALPGEAKRLDPEVKLADGNVVAAGIDACRLGSQRVQVRFVFEDGKLALVSARTPPDHYADAEVFREFADHLRGELGPPFESTADDKLIDMRQLRWRTGRSVVDLKYIPGTVVVLYHPAISGAPHDR
jgi:hypothetical protein